MAAFEDSGVFEDFQELLIVSLIILIIDYWWSSHSIR